MGKDQANEMGGGEIHEVSEGQAVHELDIPYIDGQERRITCIRRHTRNLAALNIHFHDKP